MGVTRIRMEDEIVKEVDIMWQPPVDRKKRNRSTLESTKKHSPQKERIHPLWHIPKKIKLRNRRRNERKSCPENQGKRASRKIFNSAQHQNENE